MYSHGRTRWQLFCWALATQSLITVAVMIAAVYEVGLTQRIESRQFVSDATLGGNDTLQGLLAFASVASFILTAIAFFFWIHRASSNLEPLGRHKPNHVSPAGA